MLCESNRASADLLQERSAPMSDVITRLNAALEGRYLIERDLGEGGKRVRPSSQQM